MRGYFAVLKQAQRSNWKLARQRKAESNTTAATRPAFDCEFAAHRLRSLLDIEEAESAGVSLGQFDYSGIETLPFIANTAFPFPPLNCDIQMGLMRFSVFHDVEK